MKLTTGLPAVRDGLTIFLDAMFAAVQEYRLEEFLGRHPWLAGLMAAGQKNGGYTREMVEAHVPDSFRKGGVHDNVTDFVGLQEFLAATTHILKLRPLPIMGGLVAAENAPVPTRTKTVVPIAKPGSTAASIVEVLGSPDEARRTCVLLGGFAELRAYLRTKGVKVKGNNLRSIMQRHYKFNTSVFASRTEETNAQTFTPKRTAPKPRKTKKRGYGTRTRRVKKATKPASDGRVNTATHCLLRHFGGKEQAKTALPAALKAAGSVNAFVDIANKYPEMKVAQTKLTSANVYFIMKNVIGTMVSNVLGSRK